jgi:hypothetical protein
MTLSRFVCTLACSSLLVAACGDDATPSADDTTGTTTDTTDPSTTRVETTTGVDTTDEDTTNGTTTGPDDSTDDDSTGDDSTGDDTGLEGCEGEGLASQVPVSVQGSNVGATDDHAAPCAAEGGRDVVYLWTAPAAGFYRIDTLASDYDTVLYAFAGGCDGELLACNDDVSGTFQSAIVVQLDRGETIAIVVDGFSAEDTGNYVLSIDEVVPPTCPDEDLENDLPIEQSGSTVGAGDSYASCGGIGEGGEDISFMWTAPSDGLFRFDTFGSDFDTILTVAETCDDAFADNAICNDDAGNSLQSAVFYGLDEGQSVVIIVDGYGVSGAYELNIESVPTEGDCCDAAANDSAACDDIETSMCVCAAFPECCASDNWSQLCVGLNNYLCEGQCALTPGGSCCDTSASGGCDAPVVEDCVCGLDPFCCETEWDAQCVATAVDVCAAECN